MNRWKEKMAMAIVMSIAMLTVMAGTAMQMSNKFNHAIALGIPSLNKKEVDNQKI